MHFLSHIYTVHGKMNVPFISFIYTVHAPLLFRCNKVRFPCVKAHIINVTLTVYHILLFVPCIRQFVGNVLNLGKLKKDTPFRDSIIEL